MRKARGFTGRVDAGAAAGAAIADGTEDAATTKTVPIATNRRRARPMAPTIPRAVTRTNDPRRVRKDRRDARLRSIYIDNVGARPV